MSTPSTARLPTGPPGAATARGAGPGLTLAIIVACQLMIGVDTSVVTIALPAIQDGLHFSTTGLAWIQNSYMLALGGLVLLGGRAGDILGRRRVFQAGVLLFTAASLLGGLATAGWWLLAARTVQGAAAAITGPSAMALIAAGFEGPARVRALSILSAVIGSGAALGMIVGGVLTEWASWRWVFFVNVPIGVLVAALIPRVLPETARRPGRFDLPGALTATLGMTALVYGFVRAASDGWRDRWTLAGFAAALVLLVLMVAIETRVHQPVVLLRLLRDRDRAAAYACQLLLVAAMFGAYFFLTQYLQGSLHYGPLRAGAAFLPMVLAQFTCARLVPRLLPHLGARRVVLIGATVITIGLLWLTLLSPDSGYATLLLGPLALMGVGGGLTITPLNSTVLTGVAPQEVGAASGLAQTMIWGGGALGTAVLVTVFGTAARHTTGTAEHVAVHGMTVAFAIGAIFAGCAALTALTALRPRPAPAAPAR